MFLFLHTTGMNELDTIILLQISTTMAFSHEFMAKNATCLAMKLSSASVKHVISSLQNYTEERGLA